MALMMSESGNDLMVDCHCGCDDGIRMRINREDTDLYCITTFTNGNFYRDQRGNSFREKVKKIYSIIFNRDYYYSEIYMSRDDFKQFQEYIGDII